MSSEPAHRPRVAISNLFCLADQYDLAAEFEAMLKALGETCDVLHLSMGGPRPCPAVPPNVVVDELPMKVNRAARVDILLKSLLVFLLLPVAAARLRRFKPDVIYLPDIIPLHGLFLKWLVRTRVALSYGDWHLHNKLGGRWWSGPILRFAEWIERMEVKGVDAFTCRASAAAERLKQMGIAPAHIRVFHDAPDLGAFNPHDESALRARCGFKPDDIVLLYHGVMHQGKGIDRLLRWVADLHTQDPRYGLILVGSGPELARLRALAAELRFDARVFFTGWLKTTREVGDYCNAADLCVAMRTGDEANVHIVPGALLHCMACRRVVLAPHLPGIAEILHQGQNGYMFKADDGEAFKELVRELARNRGDWDRVAETAYRDILDNYSIAATARHYAGALAHFATI